MSPAEESVTRTNLVWGTQQGCVCVLCFGLSRPAVRMTGNCECVPEERLEDSLSLCVCVSLFSPPQKSVRHPRHPIPSHLVLSHLIYPSSSYSFAFPLLYFPPSFPISPGCDCFRFLCPSAFRSTYSVLPPHLLVATIPPPAA